MVDTAPLVGLSEAAGARLRKFSALVSDFLNGRMPPEQFRHSYHEHFEGDPTRWPESVYVPLNEIFLDLDEFVADPALREGDPDAIDEGELRRRVTTAFAALQSAQQLYTSQP